MQIKTFNNNTILKTWYRILQDAQVCTIITVEAHLSFQFAFHTFLLAPDTDLSTFTTGRAHYSQLIITDRINCLVCQFDLTMTIYETGFMVSIIALGSVMIVCDVC